MCEHLIFIPSQLCTAAVWRTQIDALRGEVHIAVANQREHDSMGRLAESILDAAPAHFALAAHGMGGFIAFEIWRRAAGRVKQLALFDTLAAADTPSQTARREMYAVLAREGQFEQVIESRLPLLLHADRQDDAQLLAIVRTMAADTGVEAFLRQQRAIIDRADSRPDLAAIDCPTLVVIGRDDRITSVADAQLIAGTIPGAQLEIIESCGHLVPLEAPHRATALLRDWLHL